MNTMVDVGAIGDFASGTMKIVTIQDDDYLLARVGDEFFATQARCPHMGGHLAEGTLEGSVVTCPRHGSRFDLRDGSVVRWTDYSGLTLQVVKVFRSPRSLTTYPVTVEGERVLVGTESS